MDFSSIIAQFLTLFFVFCICIFYLRRFLWRRRKRLGRKHLGFFPQALLLGNALQTLQLIAQPHTRHVLAETLKEEVDEDESGGPEDPTKHFHRQIKRIRRGEEVDRLTVLLRR